MQQNHQYNETGKPVVVVVDEVVVGIDAFVDVVGVVIVVVVVVVVDVIVAVVDAVIVVVVNSVVIVAVVTDVVVVVVDVVVVVVVVVVVNVSSSFLHHFFQVVSTSIVSTQNVSVLFRQIGFSSTTGRIFVRPWTHFSQMVSEKAIPRF